MRFGLVIYGSLDTLSGGYLYDRMLVRQLRLLGHEVEVCSLPWRDYANHLEDNFNHAWLARLAGLDVDLLLQDELNHPSLLTANRLLRQHRRFPVVSIVHHLRSSEAHPAPLLPLYRQAERQYLRSVDGLLCNSFTTRQAAQTLAGHRQPVHVAWPAANHLPGPDLPDHAIAQRAQETGPLRLLFVGNLIPRKGLHTLLDALDQVDRSLWQLTVVGCQDVDYAYAKRIGRQITAMGAIGQVHLAGRLSDDTLGEAYRHHHLLAVPSFEGFGIVYLEAMRWGLPVLASTAGAAPEVVTHGVDGLLAPPGAAATLACHIHTLATRRGQLLTMGLAARRHYLQHPTWEQSMGAACAWLQTLVQKP